MNERTTDEICHCEDVTRTKTFEIIVVARQQRQMTYLQEQIGGRETEEEDLHHDGKCEFEEIQRQRFDRWIGVRRTTKNCSLRLSVVYFPWMETDAQQGFDEDPH